MDDLTSRLTQLLNDPEQLQQIMDVAKSMGQLTEEEISRFLSSTPEGIPELINGMSSLLQQTRQQSEKQEALFHALRPYLKPGRQSKLDRAMQIAKLSHLAEAAIKSGKL